VLAEPRVDVVLALARRARDDGGSGSRRGRRRWRDDHGLSRLPRRRRRPTFRARGFVTFEILQDLQRVLAETRSNLGEVLIAHLPHLVIELELFD
jgi:hypothetical protein